MSQGVAEPVSHFGPFGPAFDTAIEAQLAVDLETGAILDANGAAAHLLGYERGRLKSMQIFDLHPGQAPALIAFTQAVEARGTYWARTLSPRRADGTGARVETGGVLVRTPRRRRLLMTLCDLDARQRRDIDAAADTFMREGVAEWQRVDRAFRDIERENRLILRAVGEGIYGVNAEGKTTFVNPAAEQILGWTAEEMIGQDMHVMVHHHHPDGSHYAHEHCPIYAAFRDGAVHQVENEVFWHRSGKPVWVEYTSTPLRDRGVLIGAVVVFRDVTQKREANEQLRAALAEVDSLRERLELENAYLQEEIRAEGSHRGIIGRSEAIQKVLRQVELVAPTDATVLVTGESGTGKELIARAIHEASERHERPLIRVNCAAIPRELFESEFFGHVKGAFTGALRDRIGRFELADRGTLFLDEVGEIPLELQSKLLRVLQEGQFERVGEERTRQVDVRIIAATNRDLRGEVRAGRFREDLFYRLNVMPIESVPLRERREDIPLLAMHFLSASRKPADRSLQLSEGDMRRLSAYDWPGNVRELQNVIERGIILARNGRLTIDLPGGERRTAAPSAPVVPSPLETEEERRMRLRESILKALEAAGGKVSGPGGAAERLGLKPTTLASRMKAMGIEAPRLR
ncbi:sigma 54-interacting transcriptional regulator [Aquabacter sp. L1I39]|uniref:sigma 54-interacting transcriptional regulator n=1 Tax=Aquabacter sp. L1I39 TaxID=2820278 RepID=UPI001ADABD46|nr:sigma 54-interacting transcriptional regulator [Aquabacter sp. L1I39]QTL04938.1 sigma 54-interacting transcriptional regulator [Aquabacter sp. L1I39]